MQWSTKSRIDSKTVEGQNIQSKGERVDIKRMKPLLDGFQNDQSKTADSLSYLKMFSKMKQFSLMSPHQGSNQLAAQTKMLNHIWVTPTLIWIFDSDISLWLNSNGF